MTIPKVLVVDDDELARSGIVALIEDQAVEVRECDSVASALEFLKRYHTDVVLCDVYMPGTSGLELIRTLREQRRDLAFVFMSGRPLLPDVISACRLRATDFLIKPFTRRQIMDALSAAYEAVSGQREITRRITQLSADIGAKTSQLENALANLELTQRCSLEALVTALEARESETCAHSFRVRAYTLLFASFAEYPAENMAELETAALLHDVGKIAIPDSVLLKRGKLSAGEFEFCKRHSVIGEQIIGSVPSFKGVAKIVRHHHEHWDGRGYPDGLKGEDIPLGSRLFALADALDAITSDRCYRNAESLITAQNEILRCSGTQFDPALAELIIRIPDEKWIHARALAEKSFYLGAGRAQNLSLDISQFTPPRYPLPNSI